MSSATWSPLAVTATGLDTVRNGRETRHLTRSMSGPEWKEDDGTLSGCGDSRTFDPDDALAAINIGAS